MFVYADNAATTQPSRAAIDAMTPYLTTLYGNPSSPYGFAQMAKHAIEQSRREIAEVFGARPSEIIFTSGGSEADDQAIVSMAYAGAKRGRKHIVSTKFEHHAVLNTLNRLALDGFEITLLDVHPDGIVRPDEVANAIREDTALVTVMLANNEIGTVQPVSEIGAVCHERGVPFHTDAVQAAGHIPINVRDENIDLMSISGHKFHAPKGVGALYCRTGLELTSLIEGGAQERGKRAGTENVPGIAAMAAALKESVAHMAENTSKIVTMRDRLVSALGEIPGAHINGSMEHHVPGTVNISFEGIEGESLLLMLDDHGICASSGSACTSGSLDPSHVLLALGLPRDLARASLRLSIGEYNTPDEIEYIIQTVPRLIERLRV